MDLGVETSPCRVRLTAPNDSASRSASTISSCSSAGLQRGKDKKYLKKLKKIRSCLDELVAAKNSIFTHFPHSSFVLSIS
jgi:hypothetical protein